MLSNSQLAAAERGVRLTSLVVTMEPITNPPCVVCGNTTTPLHTNMVCGNCGPSTEWDLEHLLKVKA